MPDEPTARARVWLEICCVSWPRRVAVTIHAPGDARAAEQCEPFARWLRRQRTRSADGWAHIHVSDPDALARAFTTPGAITSAHALDEAAGLTWELQSTGSRGTTSRFLWYTHVRARLDDELGRRAARARPTRPSPA